MSRTCGAAPTSFCVVFLLAAGFAYCVVETATLIAFRFTIASVTSLTTL